MAGATYSMFLAFTMATMNNQHSNTGEATLCYADRGIAVFPLERIKIYSGVIFAICYTLFVFFVVAFYFQGGVHAASVLIGFARTHVERLRWRSVQRGRREQR